MLESFFNEVAGRKSSPFHSSCLYTIVGKGDHTPHFLAQPPPPFAKIPLFLEIQDVPTFYRPIGKTKVLNESFNQLLYNFYP